MRLADPGYNERAWRRTLGSRAEVPAASANATMQQRIGGSLAEKNAAKLRRREQKEARAKEKTERTGPSPAQEAEAVRKSEVEEPRQAERRTGLDGSVGGDTAGDRRS